MIRFPAPPPRAVRRLPGVRTPLRRLAKRRAPLGPVRVNVAGLTLDLAPADNKVDFDVWYKRRFDEAQEYAFLADHMRPDELFVDVGANIGLYSAAVLVAVPRSSAVAFEPLAHLRKRFIQNMALNGISERVRLLPHAVGPRGRMTLYRNANAGASSLIPTTDALGTEEVDVIPLADVIAADGPRVGALKIDVEGFEDQALLPLLDAFDRDRWPRAVALETLHCGIWRQNCLLELIKKGYSLRRETVENALLAL
ncbi:MAG: FkbM family methyltransferase [Pseudomonadota bacterium]